MDNKPIKNIRFGAVEASIWQNETNGRKTHSVTFKRSYKDGETWKDSESFRKEHLPLLIKAADTAFTHIYTEIRSE